MIRIRDLSLSPDDSLNRLVQLAAKTLRLKEHEIGQLHIYKKSIDARKKQDIRINYTVDVQTKEKEEKLLKRLRNPKLEIAEEYIYQPPICHPAVDRPVVIGFGPAGMFASLVLALAGLRPLILERGEDVDSRTASVEQFWSEGALNPKSNVQFGEGGAGTFSDGKLNTGTKNPRIRWVLQQLADAGAQPEILYDAKPHIGTDVLVKVVRNLREKIISLGGEVRFCSQVTGFEQQDGHLCKLTVTDQTQTYTLACRHAILAIGHSARDTFETLYDFGLQMEQKPFSMGVRIEHSQKLIDQAQYGAFAGHPNLPTADYKLSVHLPDGTSAYTFCMCPGGKVVAAASEAGRVVTNGMSDAARDGENANSALLVTLNPKDFPDNHPLSGMYWQRSIEEAAFAAGGRNYRAPAQTVEDFLAHRPSTKLGSVTPTYRPGVTLCDLHQVLPASITSVLEQALPQLDQRLHGFAAGDSVMTAPETRSSSPVRIVRNEEKQSSLSGLYPCGEGAGYAGGIVSAAVDGILCAEALAAAF